MRWALCMLCSCAVLFLLLLLLLQAFLALALFSVRDVGIDDASGALVDSATGMSKVGTAMTMQLQPLWDYPALSLDELRQVEDVVFVHNQATHMLRVSVATRTEGGTVLLKAADGSEVRVAPDGRSYWRRLGHPEEHLEAMEIWRTAQRSEEVQWLTSGMLATQVTVPV